MQTGIKTDKNRLRDTHKDRHKGNIKTDKGIHKGKQKDKH